LRIFSVKPLETTSHYPAIPPPHYPALFYPGISLPGYHHGHRFPYLNINLIGDKVFDPGSDVGQRFLGDRAFLFGRLFLSLQCFLQSLIRLNNQKQNQGTTLESTD